MSDWIWALFSAFGYAAWYFIGYSRGYLSGFSEGAAAKRRSIIAGFDECLARGDMKIYVRKGSEPVLQSAEILIDSMPVGRSFKGSEVMH